MRQRPTNHTAVSLLVFAGIVFTCYMWWRDGQAETARMTAEIRRDEDAAARKAELNKLMVDAAGPATDPSAGDAKAPKPAGAGSPFDIHRAGGYSTLSAPTSHAPAPSKTPRPGHSPAKTKSPR